MDGIICCDRIATRNSRIVTKCDTVTIVISRKIIVKFTTVIFSLANFFNTLGLLMFIFIFDFNVDLVVKIQKIFVRLAVRPLNYFRYFKIFEVITLYFVW